MLVYWRSPMLMMPWFSRMMHPRILVITGGGGGSLQSCVVWVLREGSSMQDTSCLLTSVLTSLPLSLPHALELKVLAQDSVLSSTVKFTLNLVLLHESCPSIIEFLILQVLSLLRLHPKGPYGFCPIPDALISFCPIRRTAPFFVCPLHTAFSDC
jgi:hypothetical protein